MHVQKSTLPSNCSWKCEFPLRNKCRAGNKQKAFSGTANKQPLKNIKHVKDT